MALHYRQMGPEGIRSGNERVVTMTPVVFDHPSFADHESIHFFDQPDSGLKAIIAIHTTVLGPATGGCRVRGYKNEHEALTDALTLPRKT